MTSKKITLTGLALALTWALAPAPASAEDLMQAYQLARQSDPQLAAAEAQKGSVGEGVKQARALLLPQISASMSYSKDEGAASGVDQFPDANGNLVLAPFDTANDKYNRSYRGALSQSIFDLSNYTRLRGARSNASRGEADYQTALQSLLLRTSTLYFAVLTAEDALIFAEANEKALARQLDQAEQRFEVGLSAITDVHDARARHDSAVASTILSRNSLDDAREALGEVTGKTFVDLKRLRQDMSLDRPSPTDPQAWVDLAMNSNPSLASRRFSVDAADANIQTQRAGHYPTLSASLTRTDTPAWADLSGTSAGSSSGRHTNSWGGDTVIGFTLSVPIFSGGATSSRARQAVFDRDTAQDQFEQQRRAVVRQTRNAFRSVIAGISEVEARKQAVVSAQSALEATQAGFEVGTRTIVDVLISQQNLFQAQSDYSQARHSFVINGLTLKQSAGTIDVKDLETVNTMLE